MSQSTKGREKRIVILGESGVGKTCLTDRFIHDDRYVRYEPFPDPDAEVNKCRRTISVDDEFWAINIEDLSLTPLLERDPNFRRDIFEQSLSHADGVILAYDITSKSTYTSVTEEGHKQVWNCRKSKNEKGEEYVTGRQRFGCVLVGNKVDLADGEDVKWRREVKSGLAEEWASMHGMKCYEMDSFQRDSIEEAMRGLVRSIKRAERRDAEDLAIERDKPRNKDSTKDGKDIGAKDGSIDGKGKKKASKETSALSRSLSKLRNALPRIKLKTRASES